MQIYAKRWVDLFKEIPIKSIALYRYSCEFKLSKYAKYAVIFVVDEKIPEEVYSKFEAALACCTDDDADDQKVIYELQINKNFQDVYKEQPESNFLSEWQFLSKISGKKMPRKIMTEEPRWVLFPVKDYTSISFQDIPSVNIQNETTEGFFESIDPSIKDRINFFKLIGQNWLIKYEDEIATFRDLERIRYIAHLLNKPLVKISAVDLFEAVKKENISEKIKKHSDTMEYVKSDWENLPEEKLNEKGVSLTDLAIDGLTKDDKDNFEDEVYKIYNRLNDAEKNNNQQAIDRAKQELESFKNHLLNEYGIKTNISPRGIKFIQKHRPGPEIERARKNVTNQIKNAIKDIKKEMPAFAQHLSNHIETGKDCIYRPDDTKAIDWHIIW